MGNMIDRIIFHSIGVITTAVIGFICIAACVYQYYQVGIVYYVLISIVVGVITVYNCYCHFKGTWNKEIS